MSPARKKPKHLFEASSDDALFYAADVERIPSNETTTAHEIVTVFDGPLTIAGTLFVKTGKGRKVAKVLTGHA